MGACCLPSNSCLDNLSSEDCSIFGGTPWPSEALYDSYTCSSIFNTCEACNFEDTCYENETTGACCIEDNACALKTQENCENAGGFYRGDNSSCDSDPCSTVDGSCCCQTGQSAPYGPCEDSTFTDGCANIPYTDCWTAGAALNTTVWQEGECCNEVGGVPVCDPDFSCCTVGDECSRCNECPGSTEGSCCYIDPWGISINDSCTDSTEGICVAQGSYWQFIPYTCSQGQCNSVNRGACCLNDGNCERMSSDNCSLVGGAYRGNNVSCDDVTCTDGACCDGAGGCEYTWIDDCDYDIGNGFFPGQSCGSNLCDIGACCYQDMDQQPTCTDDFFASYCNSIGVWHNNVFCSELGNDADCYSPTGSCCRDDRCTINTEWECQNEIGGYYRGDGTDCTNGCNLEACCFSGEMPDGTIHDCFGCIMMETGICGVCNAEVCEYPNGTPNGTSCPTGACCYGGDDGTSYSCPFDHVGWDDCIGFGGTFVGPETTCDGCVEDGECDVCFGSCCYTDASDEQQCTNTTIQHCIGNLSDTYGLTHFEGFNTNCSDNPCPNPGACCNIVQGTGTCVDGVQEWDCQEQLQFFHEDQLCSDIPCDNPTDGACCLGGTCFAYHSWLSCLTAGGEFYNDTDECGGVQCTNGACCKSIDSETTCGAWSNNECNCLDSTGQEIPNCIAIGMEDCTACDDDIAFACCSRVNGMFTGNCIDGLYCDYNDLMLDGQYCSDNPCELGSCCYEYEGSTVCIMTVAQDCGLRGGEFLLESDCAEADCEQDSSTIGSCCIEVSPGCLEVSNATCNIMGGDWTPDEYCQANNSCSENNWGACCRIDDTSPICGIESSFDCEILGGEFYYHEECSFEVCGYTEPPVDCIICGGDNQPCQQTGCPDGMACCPDGLCKESCGGEPCTCSDGHACCPDGGCDHPCDPDGCGIGSPCPYPLECCDGENDDFPNCKYPCDGPEQLILCCNPDRSGPCPTQHTGDPHPCGVSTPEECGAAGGFKVPSCSVCHDICCPLICCKPNIGSGCVVGECEPGPDVPCFPAWSGFYPSPQGNENASGGGRDNCGGCTILGAGNCDDPECGSIPATPCDCGECIDCNSTAFASRGSACSEAECQPGSPSGHTCCCCDDECTSGCKCLGPDDPLEHCFNGGDMRNSASDEDILTNLRHTHTYVEVSPGECAWMECTPLNCPYPICPEEEK